MSNNDLFKSNAKSVDYITFLTYVQSYLTEKYPELLNENVSKEELSSYILKFYNDNNYIVNETSSVDQLLEWIYNDMAMYSILTDYLNGKDKTIEEINVNSWDDIVIHYNDGRRIKSKRKFFNAQHAIDITKRLLHESDMSIDSTRPLIRGYLDKDKRISSMLAPILDKEVGAANSIRIVNPQKLGKGDFIKNQTATEQMLDFLCMAIRYNTSICVAGITGSGKTTLLSYILSSLPDSKRVITIEEGVREFDLIKRDENGKVKNNVIQMKSVTRDNEKESITSEELVSFSLTMDPDVIAVAEMKDKEAFAAQEAARTGHAVISTVHSDSAEDSYDRISTLCILKHQMDFSIMNTLVRKAFPIVVYCKQLEDNTRHIMSINECYFDTSNTPHISVLFRYVIDENIYNENGKCTIKGHFEKVNSISDNLKRKFIENGIPQNVLKEMEGNT